MLAKRIIPCLDVKDGRVGVQGPSPAGGLGVSPNPFPLSMISNREA